MSEPPDSGTQAEGNDARDEPGRPSGPPPGAGGPPPSSSPPPSNPPPGGWQDPRQNWRAPWYKPGTIPIRPLKTGEIVDGAFTTIRQNPVATLGLAAIIGTIATLISVGVALSTTNDTVNITNGSLNGGKIAQFVILDLVVLLATLFLNSVVLTGLLTTVVGRGALGDRLGIGQAWRAFRPRLAAVLGSALLIALISGGTIIAGIGAGVALAFAIPPAGIVIAVLLGIAAIVFGMIFYVRLSMSVPVTVLEAKSPVDSVRRSWRLVRKSSWRVFGIMLLAELIVSVTEIALHIPFQLLAALAHGTGGNPFFPSGSGSPPAAILITAVGTIAGAAVAQPIMAGVVTILYLDLRMRREGMDITLRTAAANGGTSGNVWTMPRQPAQGQQPDQRPAQPDQRPGPSWPEGPDGEQSRW